MHALFYPPSPISPSFDYLCSPQEGSIYWYWATALVQEVMPAHMAALRVVCVIPLLLLLFLLLSCIIDEAFC